MSAEKKSVQMPTKENQDYLLYILNRIDTRLDNQESKQDSKFLWLLGGLLTIIILIITLHFK